jgi:3-methyladenine DNA glycosylase AlkD
MLKDLSCLQNEIRSHITLCPEKATAFFKTAPGTYGAHDQFLGVTVPSLRKIMKSYGHLSLEDLVRLLHSSYNEERLMALFLMVRTYDRGDESIKGRVYHAYVDHMDQVNNWNLVDASAHLIVGAHLQKRDRDILHTWAQSPVLWHRRIAIVASWAFIKQGDLMWTFQLAQKLIKDPEDLMHKAVGWMLREAGKKDETALRAFLKDHGSAMPSVMRRYAMERLS